MISLDTNLIFSALNAKDANHQRALAALNRYKLEAMCVCPVVRSELRASRAWAGLEGWLTLQGIQVVWEMPPSVWDAAGVAYGNYAMLRKSGTLARRIAADFLIGAHAEYHQLEMLTFDETIFKAVFPQVKVLAT